MSVSCSKILGLSVDVKENLNYITPNSCLVKSALGKFINFDYILNVVVDYSANCFLDVFFTFSPVLSEEFK